MNTLRIQQGNNIEVVTTDIIKKLYDVALSIPAPLEGETDPVYLSGNLLVDKTYATYVEYLTGRFPDLHINVTGAYYVAFEDPEVERVLKTTVSSDGVGVTTVDCENVTDFTTLGLSGNTSILTFDELKYFTNIKSLPASCLSGTTNITKINLRNIESVGNYALSGKTSLSDVVSSSNLRTIGTGAFKSTTSLSLIDLTNVTSLGDEAFGWSGIQDINCPNLLTMVGGSFRDSDVRTVTDLGSITTLPEASFWNCSNLTSVTLPTTVTTIGNKPFKNCSSLVSVTGLTNVTTIPSECFLECRSLTSLTIPATVTTIYDYAFANCRALHTLSFDHGYIGGQHTFENCYQLNKIYVNDIASWYTISATRHSDAYPMSCNSLTKQLFDSNGDHVTALVLPEGVTAPTNVSETEIGRAFWYTDITSVDFPSTLTVATGFNYCSSLASIDISKCTNLTTIGRLGFSECSNLVFDVSNLPQTVTSIENSAFHGCSKVTGALNLPNATYIGGSAFESTGITAVSGIGTITRINYRCFRATRITSINIPNTCTYIGEAALADINTLTTVTGGSNVTEIGNWGFSACTNLTSINSLSNIRTVGTEAFKNCTSLTGVINLSNVTSIGDGAFNGCSVFDVGTTLNMPNLTSLGSNAFLNSLPNLTTITSLGSISKLKSWTFANCSNLTSVTLPNTLTEMNGTAFAGTGVTKLIYPEGVIKAEYGTNYDIPHYSLLYIEIPSTCTNMGSFFHRAFEYANYPTGIVMVVKATTPPTLTYQVGQEYKTGDGMRSISAIYVPDASLQDYQSAANGWSLSVVNTKIKAISDLQTDNPTMWAEYQSRVTT